MAQELLVVKQLLMAQPFRTISPPDQRFPPERDPRLGHYFRTREYTERLCEPLITEDFGIQSMNEVSPPKWHLAHSTWFFENFVLAKYSSPFRPFHPRFRDLFESHRLPHPGFWSRPSVEDIFLYRAHVDAEISALYGSSTSDQQTELEILLALGLEHERAHQEFLLCDIKHIFWSNPLRPSYASSAPISALREAPREAWFDFAGGLKEIGSREAFSPAAAAETPRHISYLNDFRLHSRLITNAEYLEFIESGGYQDPSWWLADGWAAVTKHGWTAPLYWERSDNDWWVMTLSGLSPLLVAEPVSHVSYYEADAFARWRGSRLPTEVEWEVAVEASGAKVDDGNFLENERFHPFACDPEQHTLGPMQFYGDLWEWTASSFLPYPGFVRPQTDSGDYESSLMCNRMVLRGGSCVSPRALLRPSYRHHLSPESRWQFTGIRLARDVKPFPTV